MNWLLTITLLYRRKGKGELDQGHIDGARPPPNASRYHFPFQNHVVASSSLSLVTLEKQTMGGNQQGLRIPLTIDV